MQIVPAGQPLRQPNVCFICENWPNPDSGLPVVDTLRDFEPQLITKLTGRKYVCHACAHDIGQTIGLVDESLIEAPEPVVREMTLFEMLEAVKAAIPDLPFDMEDDPSTVADDLSASPGGLTIEVIGEGTISPEDFAEVVAEAEPVRPAKGGRKRA